MHNMIYAQVTHTFQVSRLLIQSRFIKNLGGRSLNPGFTELLGYYLSFDIDKEFFQSH